MDENSIIIHKFAKIFTDKSECYNVWLKVANQLLKKYFNGKRGRAYKAEDVVQEVMLKVIEGIRKWDPEESPDLSHFMIWNIKSFIHSLYKKERHHDYIEDISNNNSDDNDMYNIPGCISPENIELNYELMEKIKIFYDRLEAEEEYECLKVIEYMRLEYKNSEIAERLEMKTSDVVNIKKRIKNKLKYYFDGHEKSSDSDKKIKDKNEEFLDRLIKEHSNINPKNYFFIFTTIKKRKSKLIH